MRGERDSRTDVFNKFICQLMHTYVCSTFLSTFIPKHYVFIHTSSGLEPPGVWGLGARTRSRPMERPLFEVDVGGEEVHQVTMKPLKMKRVGEDGKIRFALDQN